MIVSGAKTIRWSAQNGTSVTIVANKIRYATSDSGTSKPEQGWQDSIPSVQDGQYLWTWTYIEYSDGNVTNSYSVSRMGVNGVGIVSSIITYSQQATQIAPENIPAEEWGNFPSDLIDGYWLYTKTEITYSSNSKTVSYSVSQVGVGAYYAGVQEYYAAHNSASTPPVGYPSKEQYSEGEVVTINTPWSVERPVLNSTNPYLWNFEISRDSRGNQYVTQPICIGNFSRGIVSITESYALSISNELSNGTPTIIGEWQGNQSAVTPNENYPYQWNKTVTTYTDGTTDTIYHISAVMGRGVKSIETRYFALASKENLIGNNTLWDSAKSDYSDWNATKKWLYSITKTTFTDNTVSWAIGGPEEWKKDGEDAASLVLSPNNETFRADSNGVALEVTPVEFYVRIVRNGTVVPIGRLMLKTVDDDAAWKTFVDSNTFVGDVYIRNVTALGNFQTWKVEADITDMSYKNDNAWIDVKATGYDGNDYIGRFNVFAVKEGIQGDKGEDATIVTVEPNAIILEQKNLDTEPTANNSFNIDLEPAKFKVYKYKGNTVNDVTELSTLNYNNREVVIERQADGYWHITRVLKLVSNLSVTISYDGYNIPLPIYINTVGKWTQQIIGDVNRSVSEKEYTAIDKDGIPTRYTLKSFIEQSADVINTSVARTVNVWKSYDISLFHSQGYEYHYLGNNVKKDSFVVDFSVTFGNDETPNKRLYVALYIEYEDGAASWQTPSDEELLITESGDYRIFTPFVYSDAKPIASADIVFDLYDEDANVSINRVGYTLNSFVKQTAESVEINAQNVVIGNDKKLAAQFNNGKLFLNEAFACPRNNDGTLDIANPTISIDGDTGELSARGRFFASKLGYGLQGIRQGMSQMFFSIKKRIELLVNPTAASRVPTLVEAYAAAIDLKSSVIYLDLRIPSPPNSVYYTYCIPRASTVGEMNLEIYFTQFGGLNTRFFITQGEINNPDYFYLQGGMYLGLGEDNADVRVYNDIDDKIVDNLKIDQTLNRKYFSADSFSLGCEFGQIALLQNSEHFYPTYIRLLSDGSNWHLLEYRYP